MNSNATDPVPDGQQVGQVAHKSTQQGKKVGVAKGGTGKRVGVKQQIGGHGGPGQVLSNVLDRGTDEPPKKIPPMGY